MIDDLREKETLPLKNKPNSDFSLIETDVTPANLGSYSDLIQASQQHIANEVSHEYSLVKSIFELRKKIDPTVWEICIEQRGRSSYLNRRRL